MIVNFQRWPMRKWLLPRRTIEVRQSARRDVPCPLRQTEPLRPVVFSIVLLVDLRHHDPHIPGGLRLVWPPILGYINFVGI